MFAKPYMPPHFVLNFIFQVSPEQGLKIQLSGSAATAAAPTTLSPSSLIIDWACIVSSFSPIIR